MTDTTDDYGYLLVHFIEDPDGYAEKIYMDISDGDNPHRWVPLNDGKPVLASHLGTTGVRDPHIIRNPDTGTWYIIATDLRVFGGDGGGWYEWSHHASTNLIIWESDDLLHWSEPRMLDVSRKPDGSHLELGMAWACECLWVPDYYPQGHHGGRGAFVMYWSAPCSMMRTRLTTTRTFTALCCGAPPPISRRTRSNMVACSSTTTVTPSTPR